MKLDAPSRNPLADAWRAVRPNAPAARWVHAALPPEAADALRAVEQMDPVAHLATCSGSIDPFETWLAQTSPKQRRERGAWFTPAPMCDYLVARANALARDAFGFAGGLFDETAPLVVWDPAAGAGAFTLALLRRGRSTWEAETTDRSPANWSRWIERVGLSRWRGVEMDPSSLALLWVRLADALARCEYDFASTPPASSWRLGDALDPAIAERALGKREVPVVVGNPPYASLSRPRHGWIEGLLRGDVIGQASYRPGGERKTWLHDDYVKFVRLAQWQIERAGAGVVAFVTNHGWLDAAGFCEMRRAIRAAFDTIEVVDLHGNRKMHEQSPDGTRDENVFRIGSGVAMLTAARPWGRLQPANALRLSDLWGTAQTKLSAIATAVDTDASLAVNTFSPTESGQPWSLTANPPERTDWDSWLSLPQAMPITTTAPVTARDRFVIDANRDALVARLERFVDLTIPDATIRDQFFGRGRSPRYPPGDTRSWKLGEARRRLAADPAWRSSIRKALYRPFDIRWIAWHDALIDWPRRETTRHFLDRPNVVLLTRRQGLPGRPYTFFWATAGLTLDGVLRSDNKGSESLFPIWLYDGETTRPNLAPALVADWTTRLGMPLVPLAQCAADVATLLKGKEPERPSTCSHWTEWDAAGWTYGCFFSPVYRTEHAARLRREFPRIPPPNDVATFFTVARLGQQLLRLHIANMDRSDADKKNDNAAPLTSDELDQAAPYWVGGRQPLLALRRSTRSKRETTPERIEAIARTLMETRHIEAELVLTWHSEAPAGRFIAPALYRPFQGHST